MRACDRGAVVVSDASAGRRSCCFPSICILPTGRWLCGFRAGPLKGGSEQTVLLTWSGDQGRTWSKPVEPFRPPMLEGRPGRYRALTCTALGGPRVLATLSWIDYSHPDLPFFNEQTQGLIDAKLLIAISQDQGETWSTATLVDTTPYHQPTPITGPTLILPDGRWGCQFELNKAYEDPQEWRHGSVMTFSADQGRTWGDAVLVSQDPANRIFYWDQRPDVLADGTVLDLFWTYDNAAAKYLNIHARSSVDSGRTWGPMWDTGVPGQPASPRSLPNGEVIVVYYNGPDRDSTNIQWARLTPG